MKRSLVSGFATIGLLPLGLALVGSSPVLAEIYTVYPDGSGVYPTIQAAIDAAEDNDIVELVDGVFMGSGNTRVSFCGKAITVRSQIGSNGNFSEDPLFCDGCYYLQACSPCAPGNHPDDVNCGLIGAYGVGCPCGGGPTAVDRTSWSSLKALYR